MHDKTKNLTNKLEKSLQMNEPNYALSREISVIIPVFNCKNYLSEAVLSVLRQPYKAIRIILIDDGSTDGSSELCDQLAIEYAGIHVIHQENEGVSSARNTGIEFALTVQTDYVAFLDADDKWEDGFLDDSVEELLSKEMDLIGFQSCHCNNNVSRRDHPSPLQEGHYCGGASNVWLHSSQSFAAMLYSIHLLQAFSIRFMKGLKYGEDCIFHMQCMCLARKISLENKLMYLYRRNPTSAVHDRKYGIGYFVPIIDAWLQSDRTMECWRTEQRGTLWEGRAMAAVCIADMVEEHFQHLGKRSELEVLMLNKPEYVELINELLAHNRVDIGRRYQNMIEHPFKFRLRCYAEGTVSIVLRYAFLLLNRNAIIAKLIDKRRYSVTL